MHCDGKQFLGGGDYKGLRSIHEDNALRWETILGGGGDYKGLRSIHEDNALRWETIITKDFVRYMKTMHCDGKQFLGGGGITKDFVRYMKTMHCDGKQFLGGGGDYKGLRSIHEDNALRWETILGGITRSRLMKPSTKLLTVEIYQNLFSLKCGSLPY